MTGRQDLEARLRKLQQKITQGLPTGKQK